MLMNTLCEYACEVYLRSILQVVISKVHQSSEEFYAPFLCAYHFADITNYPDLERGKLEEQGWLNQFVSPAKPAKSWAQYHIQKKNIQLPTIEDTHSLLSFLKKWSEV